MKRKNIFKTFGILLVLVMVIGSIPASAKGKEIIVTASKNKIMKALDLYGDTPATIIIKSDTRKKITIPAMEYSIYKKLVIDAPNLTLVNYTPLQSVTIKAADTYIEPMPDNRIILENPDTKIILGERFYCKVVVKSKKAVITLRKNSGKVNINVDKKDADVSVNIEKKSQGIININKKSNITISGSKKNLISILNLLKRLL